MQVNVGNSWEGLVETLLEDGRYASADAVVEDGLRLLQERELKLAWLRAKVEKALAEGVELTEADIDDALEEAEERLRAKTS